MACWDMRFQLPISSHCHPSRARIRRLSMHPLYQSWVIAGKMEGWLSGVEVFFLKVHNTAKTRFYFMCEPNAWFCFVLMMELPTTAISLSFQIYYLFLTPRQNRSSPSQNRSSPSIVPVNDSSFMRGAQEEAWWCPWFFSHLPSSPSANPVWS